jgi:hypothetical protein
MFKKIIIGLLLTTVIGAGGAAIAYQYANQEADAIASATEPIFRQQGYSAGQQGGQQWGEAVIAAEGNQGDPWQKTGTITEIDDFGFQFALQNGESVYVELGPPDYWQNQGVNLQVGQSLTVDGTTNEDMIHATQVMLADGQILQLRTETGQPRWSGGITENVRGQNVNISDGEHIPEPQAQVDEWVTIEGTLMSYQGGNITMNTTEGELITFKTGQPRFFTEQNVSLQVGEEITVIGFYENGQFMAGEITQVTTGARVMLRDPNGRPLWAGPGNSNGNGNGNGQGHGGGA